MPSSSQRKCPGYSSHAYYVGKSVFIAAPTRVIAHENSKNHRPRFKRLFALMLMIGAAFIASKTSAQEDVQQGGEFLPQAQLQFANRTTAVRETAIADSAEALEYDDMTITLRRCWRSIPPEETKRAAWIDVVRHAPSEDGVYVDPEDAAAQAETDESAITDESMFSGWIYAESPALSMPEHPIFTITLLGCTSGETPGVVAEDGDAVNPEDSENEASEEKDNTEMTSDDTEAEKDAGNDTED